MEDLRLHAPAAQRNRDPILAILQAQLPASGLILEVASGSGEHCVRFGEKLPRHIIQPSDPDPRARASIDAWIAATGLRNIRAAIELDAAAPAWPLTQADAVICINMVHIAPWAATQGLFRGAARILPPDGALFLYGPFARGGRLASQGDADFDRSLRQTNPEWGIRDLEEIEALAAAEGFCHPFGFEMPANNLTLLIRRRRPRR